MIDVAQHFGTGDEHTYLKGNYKATLDHICLSPNLLKRIDYCEILRSPIDCSDHKHVRCYIRNHTQFMKEFQIFESKKTHKFPEKSSFFTEHYDRILDPMIEVLNIECSSEPFCNDKVKVIDHAHKSLPLIMLKAAR